jgi:uncharacterized protein YeaO (DUF488 family)
MNIQLKRVYSPVEKDDGVRVLVDRVWPRGISKAKLQADVWLKDAAPSTELRKWFNHDRSKWQDFKERYFAELKDNPEAVAQLLELGKEQQVTLLYAARDTEYNHALAMREYLVSKSEEKTKNK